LTGARYRASCSAPSARIDGLVGLAGPYDIGRFAQVAEPLLGTTPAADAARWREANPMTWAAERSDVAAMLAYGSSDDLVPPTFSTEFAQALRAGGHRVDVQAITGATHASIYEVSVVADRVIAWVRALQPAGA
jgi:pimeloyl-ACP methyl ester carboxylesterase